MERHLVHNERRTSFSSAQAEVFVSMMRGKGKMAAFQCGVWGRTTSQELRAILHAVRDLESEIEKELERKGPQEQEDG